MEREELLKQKELVEYASDSLDELESYFDRVEKAEDFLRATDDESFCVDSAYIKVVYSFGIREGKETFEIPTTILPDVIRLLLPRYKKDFDTFERLFQKIGISELKKATL